MDTADRTVGIAPMGTPLEEKVHTLCRRAGDLWDDVDSAILTESEMRRTLDTLAELHGRLEAMRPELVAHAGRRWQDRAEWQRAHRDGRAS